MQHTDLLTMHWRKKRTPFGPISQHDLLIATNTAKTKYWCVLFLLYQYFKLAFELSFIAW